MSFTLLFLKFYFEHFITIINQYRKNVIHISQTVVYKGRKDCLQGRQSWRISKQLNDCFESARLQILGCQGQACPFIRPFLRSIIHSFIQLIIISPHLCICKCSFYRIKKESKFHIFCFYITFQSKSFHVIVIVKGNISFWSDTYYIIK